MKHLKKYVLVAIGVASAALSSTAQAETRTVQRTQSAVITRVVPVGVIPGTIGSALFGYEPSNTVEGSLARQYAAGQLNQLSTSNGKMFYGQSELNGTLPLLDQVSWIRWKQLSYQREIVGPMSVRTLYGAASPLTAANQTSLYNNVPMHSDGLMLVEYPR